MNSGKTARLAIIAGALLVLAGLGLWLGLRLQPLTIGLYGLDQASQAAIETLLSRTDLAARRPRILVLDSSQALDVQLLARPRPAILMSASGAALEAVAAGLRSLSAEPLRVLPASLRPLGRLPGQDRGHYAWPLQLDHYALAVGRSYQDLNPGLGLTSLSLPGLQRQLPAAPGRPALLVAGGNDSHLLAFLDALIDGHGGSAALGDWYSQLAAGSEPESLLDAPLGQALTVSGLAPASSLEATSLRVVLTLLIEWRSSGWLHPEWLRLTPADLEAAILARAAPLCFLPLSAHRRLPPASMQGYLVGLFPAHPRLVERSPAMRAHFAAINAAVPARQQEEAMAILHWLLSAQGQGELTALSGLAPIHAAAPVLDRQAADVRLWAAATRPAVLGYEPAQESALAAWLRQYLASGGL